MASFAERLIDWHREHGRHDMPWQGTRDPYRVWLSEIMLQQTQVTTVIDYYQRFLAQLPTLADLATAPVGAVMALWSGLGYYARARNLHACAQRLMENHGGQFPQDPAAIAALPGIGRSTANAIAVFCFSARLPILDGNVKRVLCRMLGIEGFPGTPAVERRLWQEAEALLPITDVATYIQAQMDLGATVCTRGKPRCNVCPVANQCVARREDRVARLPTPRPKNSLPERHATLLVIRSGSQVLLEARPPQGIWGGLLSLPELPEGNGVEDFCARQLNLAIGTVRPAPTFVHTFTHFRLHIRPLFCTADREPQLAEPRFHWIDTTKLTLVALPAPVRKILDQLSASP